MGATVLDLLAKKGLDILGPGAKCLREAVGLAALVVNTGGDTRGHASQAVEPGDTGLRDALASLLQPLAAGALPRGGAVATARARSKVLRTSEADVQGKPDIGDDAARDGRGLHDMLATA